MSNTLDNNNRRCLLVRNHLRVYTKYKTAISCQLPSTFNQYLGMISKSAHWEYRKAEKLGYKFEKVLVAPQELLEIYRSWQSKQNRSINMQYTDITFSNLPIDKQWPVQSYEPWCPNHNLELYVVKKDRHVVSFVEVLNCDDICLVHATMTHQEHIKNGVSKLTFVELVKRKLGKRLVYGTTDNLKDERKYFVRDLGITVPFTYDVSEEHPTIVLDFDDLSVGKPGLDEVIALKEHFPNLKVTFFMVPIPSEITEFNVSLTDYHKWAEWLKQQDWIEICPHGVTHGGFEMKYLPTKRKRLVDYETANLYIDAVEHTFAQLDLPYQKIWKSPHWETSPEAYRALWDRGYTVAVDPNQKIPKGGKVYVYDWSVNLMIPNYSLIHGHGHLYPPSPNAIQLCTRNLLEMDPQSEFRFISEVLL